MKLKNRLMIAFLIIAIVPLFMITAITLGFSSYQVSLLRRDFGIEAPTYAMLSDTTQLLARYTESIYDRLDKVAQEEPEQLLSREYLQGLDEELASRYSYLIVRIGDEIVYNSADEEDASVAEHLPEYGSSSADEEGSVFVGGEAQALIKQVDFMTEDGREGSLFVITSVSQAVPQMKTLLIDIILMVFIILALTGGFLTTWIYRGIINPVRKLKLATQNIKEGNLEFTLKAEGHDEISELCADFEEMRQRLLANAEEKIQFDRENQELISNISHDLKTPITAVKGYVEGIMDGVADTPEKMERYIRTIYNKANDMDRLINELTFYSKIDTNRIPYTFSKINVEDYFQDCAEEVGMDLEAKGMEFHYSNDADKDIVVIADAEQLKRVVNNIVGNSMKYMDKANGRISIHIRDVGDFIQVDISDNGKGIAMKDLQYIFDRFYRADASRNSSKRGSGIGLSIVKKIIEDHGGKIWATSKEGEGTTMSFVLRKYQEVPIHE